MPWRSEPKKPYKPREPTVTSGMMSKVRNKGGKAEVLLRSVLHARGRRFRLHVRTLPGKPDIVFKKHKVVVFVDGDFWHGRALLEEGVSGFRRGVRTERSEWWVQKMQKTVERDNYVTGTLRKDGWTVLRFWESEVLQDVSVVASEVEAVLG